MIKRLMQVKNSRAVSLLEDGLRSGLLRWIDGQLRHVCEADSVHSPVLLLYYYSYNYYYHYSFPGMADCFLGFKWFF